MRIKRPWNSEPAYLLGELLKSHRQRINLCERRRHEFTSVLFVSTYTMNTRVLIQGGAFRDILRDLISISPVKTVCALRTVAPSHWPFKRMRSMHRNQIDDLRMMGCYVAEYNPKDQGVQFVNHAKFVISLHYCFDEMIRYYGHLYGSTNITTPGLRDVSYRWKYGNYEEYHYSRFVSGGFHDYSHYSTNLIEEVMEIIEWERDKYVQPRRALSQVRRHLERLDNTIQRLDRVARGTPLVDLVEALLEASVAVNSWLAFLESLPGKIYVWALVDDLLKKYRELNIENPYELEQMLLSREYIQNNQEDALAFLGYETEEEIRIELRRRIELLKEVKYSIDAYLSEIGSIAYEGSGRGINGYMTEGEIKYRKLLSEVSQGQINGLKRTISLLKRAGGEF